ncbi:MAG: hypothetical protein IH951_16365, partial [Bacteroidetes bacterium]|nr:hypothetical protein [Bacteroidota bacterium]
MSLLVRHYERVPNLHSNPVSHRLILCFLILTLSPPAVAQPFIARQNIQLLGGVSSLSNAPFWIVTNQNGNIDSSGRYGIARISLGHLAVSNDHEYYWLGGDLIVSIMNTSAYFHQFYTSAHHGAFQLSLGWREHTAGLVDSTLSSGSFIFSRNAATIPRVSIGTPDFTDVPGAFGLIAFKAFWSHGWMGSKRFVKNPFLHEKSLHFRVFGPEDFPVLGYAGITHAVIWGGSHPEFGKIPTRLSDYVNIVFGQSG